MLVDLWEPFENLGSDQLASALCRVVASTSVRREAKRWSATMYSFSMPIAVRSKYGTGLDGSLVYWSTPSDEEGGSLASPPSAWKKSDFFSAFFGGQAVKIS